MDHSGKLVFTTIDQDAMALLLTESAIKRFDLIMSANQIVLLQGLCIDFEIAKIEQKITLNMNFGQLGICKDLSVQKMEN